MRGRTDTAYLVLSLSKGAAARRRKCPSFDKLRMRLGGDES